MKDDPLGQGYADQVREQMAKHTLWLNADNFEEMSRASWEGYMQQSGIGSYQRPIVPLEAWRAWQAAALAVVEWRMGGRVRP